MNLRAGFLLAAVQDLKGQVDAIGEAVAEAQRLQSRLSVHFATLEGEVSVLIAKGGFGESAPPQPFG